MVPAEDNLNDKFYCRYLIVAADKSKREWIKPKRITPIPLHPSLAEHVGNVPTWNLLGKLFEDGFDGFHTVSHSILSVNLGLGNHSLQDQQNKDFLYPFLRSDTKLSNVELFELVKKRFGPLESGLLVYHGGLQQVMIVKMAILVVPTDQPQGNANVGCMGPSATYSNRHIKLEASKQGQPLPLILLRNAEMDIKTRSDILKLNLKKTPTNDKLSEHGFKPEDPSIVNDFFSKFGIDMYMAHPNDPFHVLTLNWIPNIIGSYLNVMNEVGKETIDAIMQGDILDLGPSGSLLYPRLRQMTTKLGSLVGRDYQKLVESINMLFRLVLKPGYLKQGVHEDWAGKGFTTQVATELLAEVTHCYYALQSKSIDIKNAEALQHRVHFLQEKLVALFPEMAVPSGMCLKVLGNVSLLVAFTFLALATNLTFYGPLPGYQTTPEEITHHLSKKYIHNSNNKNVTAFALNGCMTQVALQSLYSGIVTNDCINQLAEQVFFNASFVPPKKEQPDIKLNWIPSSSKNPKYCAGFVKVKGAEPEVNSHRSHRRNLRHQETIQLFTTPANLLQQYQQVFRCNDTILRYPEVMMFSSVKLQNFSTYIYTGIVCNYNLHHRNHSAT